MSKCRNHPSIKSAFIGYKSIDVFRELRFTYGHIADSEYRRVAFHVLFNRSKYKCVFDTRLTVLTHMLSLTAPTEELLSYKEAYIFAIEYANSQVKQDESVWTIERFCCEYSREMAMAFVELSYSRKIACFEGATERDEFPYVNIAAYGLVHANTEIASLFKNEKCHSYLERSLGKNSFEAARTRIGQIKLFIDELLLDMFANAVSFTKETIMFNIDFVIGHERQHRTMDLETGDWNYIANHWRSVFNLTEHEAIEQECNRSGLIYAVKQYHKRKLLR